MTSVGAAMLALLCVSPAQASPQGWDRASGAARDVLIVSALALPVAEHDRPGDRDVGESLLATGAATYLLKRAIPETRPDGSDDRSFPSGHTSIAFAAAASMEARYGPRPGVPALALASFVGLARVKAHKHHWFDAVAGAAMGVGFAFLLTTDHRGRGQAQERPGSASHFDPSASPPRRLMQLLLPTYRNRSFTISSCKASSLCGDGDKRCSCDTVRE